MFAYSGIRRLSFTGFTIDHLVSHDILDHELDVFIRILA